MFKTIYYKYIFTIGVGVIITHLAFSYCMGFLTSYFYREFMINVRNLNAGEYKSASQAYLAANIKTSKKPVMLVLGTSFSYGYGLNASNTYSNLLTKQFPNYFIMNASVVGDHGEGILEKLIYLKNKKLAVDSLIIEINLFNLTAGTVKNKKNQQSGYEKIQKKKNKKNQQLVYDKIQKKIAGLIDSLTDSFSLFYLFHPHGFNSISNLDLNRLYVLGPKNEHKFSFVPLPDTYSQKYAEFRQTLPRYKKFITAVLTASRDISNHVYFFVSPIYGDGVRKTQFKLEDIEKELQDLNQICHQMSGVNCLNPGIQLSESYFSNLSHYNEEGHRALSKWLAQKLHGSSQGYLASN
ncbi:SGNH/GDSL hydrolase family protein [Legionella clemsonensis]|uniref:Uncharacterized protein n=1 Tax=Legionella clemsonensis TaxID=1867846 RepID=A0A222P6F9_9GAMM|nr:hypothetical protein [Legionella clemsonensis]ASQ47450.1 hypothetical protein clem_14625 [Legionella clemsonensis]